MPKRPAAIDLRLLRQFVAVAEELHFHRAAKRLAMSQPPLTAAIRRLEAEVGTTLIDRGNRTIALTLAGKMLLAEARALLERADRAVALTRDVAAGLRGYARLGYVGSAMYGRLPSGIRAFRHSHPEVRVELREMTSAAQVAALRRHELDVAIVIPPLANDGGLTNKAFDADRLALALPRSHRLADDPHIDLAQFAGEPFVLWPAAEGRGFHDRIIRLCAAAGFVPQIAQEAHTMQAVLSLVAVEIGVSIVPHSMASVRASDITYHAIDGDQAAFQLVLCHREEESNPACLALAAALLDMP